MSSLLWWSPSSSIQAAPTSNQQETKAVEIDDRSSLDTQNQKTITSQISDVSQRLETLQRVNGKKSQVLLKMTTTINQCRKITFTSSNRTKKKKSF